jgi:hypothetical protein
MDKEIKYEELDELGKNMIDLMGTKPKKIIMKEYNPDIDIFTGKPVIEPKELKKYNDKVKETMELDNLLCHGILFVHFSKDYRHKKDKRIKYVKAKDNKTYLFDKFSTPEVNSFCIDYIERMLNYPKLKDFIKSDNSMDFNLNIQGEVIE